MSKKPFSKLEKSKKKKKAAPRKPKLLRKRELAQLETKKKRRISDAKVEEVLFKQLLAAGTEGNVRPEDVARELYPEAWQTLLKRVRLMAKQQAVAGNLIILRKGEVADPHDFKGLIRLQVTEQYLVAQEEAADDALL